MPKFAITSDLHNRELSQWQVDSLKGVDALLICGDISGPEYDTLDSPSYRQLRKISDAGIRVIATPGNHDVFIYEQMCKSGGAKIDYEYMTHIGAYVKRRYGRSVDLGGWSLEKIKNSTGVQILVDEATEVDGVRIYGTPWCPRFCGWAFMGDDDFLKDKFAMIPKDVDILLTHTPPLFEDSEIDEVHYYKEGTPGPHCGSKVLADEIIA